MSRLPHPKRPCADCPFRLDAPVGHFPACRYEALRGTSSTPAGHPGFGAPMFACHATPEGRETACAGWLAIEGHAHVGVRMAVATGRLDPSSLVPGDDWPELFPSFLAMAEANGVPPDHPALAPCRGVDR